MRLTLSVVFLIVTVAANEMTRCCSGGARHFSQTGTCSNIRSEGTSLHCVRSASICCLRALLDAACAEGATSARMQDSCPSNINVLAGGIRKECCDCCLLAKEIVRRNEACTPPTGFSAACLKSFTRCCTAQPILVTEPHKLITETPMAEGTILHLGDRCANSKCEHLCNDRGGESVECSCRAGFELGPDGTSCIDKNECLQNPCRPRERCLNLPGTFRCQSLKRNPRMRDDPRRRPGERRMHDAPSADPCGMGFHLSGDQCLDDDECLNNPCSAPLTICLNSPGSYSCVCQSGFYFSDLAEQCLDVDECLLLMDDCLDGQRCLNTPGSFKCIRTLSCGTGYALDSHSEQCTDVDECNLGSHDCGPLYQCRNTQGSYRCDPKKCGEGELQNPRTGECTSIDCPMGFVPKNGMCNDVDECASDDRCGPSQQCVNTPGSYRCQDLGNLCADGYQTNKQTGFCEDIDECVNGACGSLLCINLPGSYKCRCSAGYEFNDHTKKCEDVDECAKFAGHVCDVSAECLNTVGSFFCKCKKGFKLATDGRHCEDVDECANGEATCEQKCVNIPGSYQCICDRGYALDTDGKTCQDIDECSVWSGSGSDLCMGGCINTRGSYICQCPPGYKIQPDGRTCVDVDECALGECKGHDRICVNTLGHFKCHHVECPQNYVHDSNYKNRCNRGPKVCEGLPESICQSKYPIHYTWQYIAIPKAVPISSHRPSVTLFTIKGPFAGDAQVQFELGVSKVITEGITVQAAVRANFLLQKGSQRNSAVIALRDSLDGPQTIYLALTLRLTKQNIFVGKYVANLVVHVAHVQDGYSCIKKCLEEDAPCLANHTREILYQFRAVPTMHIIHQPLEVSRIKAHMDIPFSVEYTLDHVGMRHFDVEQDKNIGIVRLVRPIEGPTTEIIRVHINTKSRTGVVLAYNLAVIEVHVSRYPF